MLSDDMCGGGRNLIRIALDPEISAQGVSCNLQWREWEILDPEKDCRHVVSIICTNIEKKKRHL